MTQDTLRLGLVAGRLQKIDKLKHVATARPPVTGTERGVSNREGDTNISASRPSAWNRFLLHCHPFSGTPVGSNTKTDDDCRRRQFFHRGASGAKLPFSTPHYHVAVPLSRLISSEFMKTKEINILFCCERFSAEARRGGEPGHLVLSKTVPLFGRGAQIKSRLGRNPAPILQFFSQ